MSHAPVRDALDRALSVLLVMAALAIAASLVRREFFARSAPSVGQRQSEFVPTWREIVPRGRLVGDTAATVKIIEFSDLECPSCRRFHGVVRSVMEEYPEDVAKVFVHFPLEMHRFARPAARAVECASLEGKFLPMVNVLFDKQDSLGLLAWTSYATMAGVHDTARFDECARDTAAVPAIESGIRLGAEFDVQATPTVILNGWRYGTSPSEEELRWAVEQILAGKSPYPGLPVPTPR